MYLLNSLYEIIFWVLHKKSHLTYNMGLILEILVSLSSIYFLLAFIREILFPTPNVMGPWVSPGLFLSSPYCNYLTHSDFFFLCLTESYSWLCKTSLLIIHGLITYIPCTNFSLINILISIFSHLIFPLITLEIILNNL